ncbi:MFS transporter [Adhaeretor mobilis]|uniref:Major Facilitator Superfamily protein n=1 Tax=Adhaeretor mobilis TaxID=1930276 RepID=A0A517N215_9BACT|nr:MFS transporter [Adhaeretor mobilis]QDT01186.1 Major Facilitator Superfamily protein [Adhaeretor mobilis]
MPQLIEETPPQELVGGTLAVPVETPASVSQADGPREGRNFIFLMIHQVLFRIGWIFKTESIIMPAVMDFIGGGPVMRSSLMVFNRLGFSVPQVLFARRLKVLPSKKWAVTVGSFAMAIPFTILAIIWANGWWQAADGSPAVWMPYLFLALYAVFFCTTGMNQLAAHALQGKLIRANLRGRLFAATVLVGAPTSILAAWYFLPGWLADPTTGFVYIFAAPALGFALASMFVAMTVEEPDGFQEVITPLWQRFQNAWNTSKENPNFARLAVVAVLFSATFMMFPHYQTLGRGEDEVSMTVLMKWVCVQHIAVAIFSLIIGPLADWLGNRAALRLTLFGASLAPLMAVVLSLLPEEVSRQWYWLMFAPIGFTPVTMRILINYTLEVAPASEHPRYVSAVSMCLALPVIFGAVPVGVLIRWTGYTPIFAFGAIALMLATLQTFRLAEPRHAA